MREEVVAAVAQATIRHRAGCQAGSSGCEQRGGSSQLGMVRDAEVSESPGRAARLQLQEATAAIVRLQGVVERQQGRIDALEAGGEARTGERREARVPQFNLRAHGTGSRSLAGEFEAAAAVSPQNDAEPGDLEAQVEQLWREVAAAQAIHGAAEAAAVVEAESKAEVGAGASTGGFTAIASTTEAEVDAGTWAENLWLAAEDSWPAKWLAAAIVAADDDTQAAGGATEGTAAAAAANAMENPDLSDRANAAATADARTLAGSAQVVATEAPATTRAATVAAGPVAQAGWSEDGSAGSSAVAEVAAPSPAAPAQSLAAPPIASPQLAPPPAPLSWLEMFYGETDEEYTERMRNPGRQVLSDEDEYARLIRSFPAESRSQRAARAPLGRGLEGNRRTPLRGGRREELRQDSAR